MSKNETTIRDVADAFEYTARATGNATDLRDVLSLRAALDALTSEHRAEVARLTKERDEAQSRHGALVFDASAVLSRARAEALEEAATLMQGEHIPPCYDRPVPEGTTTAQFGCGNCSRAKSIRALITTPAPATILVERVREVLAKMRNHHTSWDRATCEEAAKRLNVPLDAKGEAPMPVETCARCRLPHRKDGTSYREEDGIGILCRKFVRRERP